MPKTHFIDKRVRDVGFEMDIPYTVEISECCIFPICGNEGMAIIQVWRRESYIKYCIAENLLKQMVDNDNTALRIIFCD